MKKYKIYIIKTILFIFVMDKFLKIFNYIFNLINIDISGIFDFLSLGVFILVCVPLTLGIIEFLFRD